MSRLPIMRGRRFGCTRCGNCCMEPGYVWVEDAELRRMAAHLGRTVSAFRAAFDVAWDAQAECYAIDATHGRGCPLLDAERRCSVQAVKPAQCATFPFWPEMLEDRGEWDDAKRYCPGLDAQDGRLYSLTEIRAISRGETGT